ncbi:MAG: hypothetical protein J6C52_10470 [Clostridia bacterium]|nr:hypothetical protein [Clostridia bacterium]
MNIKKLITVCLALALAASAALSVSAASDAVLKGTPKIDGVMEEIWTQSCSVTYDNTHKGYKFGNETEPYSVDFQSYYLWDNDWFYICTNVTDNDVIDIGADAYKAKPTEWQAECVENWFNKGDKALQFKTHTDAYGHTIYFGDGTAPFTTKDVKYVIKKNDKGYTLEIAYPLAAVKGMMKDNKIHVQTQVNDLSAVGKGVALYTKAASFALSDTAVVMPKEPAKAPATADPALFALAAAASAAFITAKARRK